mmetsp:Transcript_26897/g.70741  ORF Transcript_26897/g.70741 Transcript_26897/m.70741 type:complete len:93 (+) Transcript_26897:103-381(+)
MNVIALSPIGALVGVGSSEELEEEVKIRRNRVGLHGIESGIQGPQLDLDSALNDVSMRLPTPLDDLSKNTEECLSKKPAELTEASQVRSEPQ